MDRKLKAYYQKRLQEHGATAEGVGWNGAVAQEVRFAQLCRVIQHDSFSVNDLGCGTGDLAGYLRTRYQQARYLGLDVMPAMIDAAKTRFNDRQTRFRLIKAYDALPEADYTLASGIFNLKFDKSTAQWKQYILRTLQRMNRASQFGFAFNALTKYSDKPKMKRELYYADPLWLFDFCKLHFSRNVALLHDYDLFGFTILVKK